jgi:uncharacterized protein
MGCSAFIALYSMSGRQLKEAMVHDTLSLAQDLGRVIREANQAHTDAVAAVVDRLRGRFIFQGKVADLWRRTEAGFAKGGARLEGVDRYAGSVLDLRFQNEHLVAIRDGEVQASVPDLIIVLDAESGQPITTEEIRYGFRVSVLGAPCDPRWRTPGGLQLVGPRYFGYDFDYVPLEDRLSVQVPS